LTRIQGSECKGLISTARRPSIIIAHVSHVSQSSWLSYCSDKINEREGRIRSAERVEAHLVVRNLLRTFFQPELRTAGIS